MSTRTASRMPRGFARLMTVYAIFGAASLAGCALKPEVVIVNDLPAADGGNKGHTVGLASARERVQAMTDGRGRVDAGIEDGRFVARMQLPP